MSVHKNRFTVTIHDTTQGIRQYDIHNIVKKFLFYSAFSFVVLMIGAFIFIYFLSYRLDTYEQKKSSIKQL